MRKRRYAKTPRVPSTEAKALRDLLVATGRTQSQIGEIFGVEQPRVSEWCSGARALTLAQAAKMVKLANGRVGLSSLPLSPRAREDVRVLCDVGALAPQFR